MKPRRQCLMSRCLYRRQHCLGHQCQRRFFLQFRQLFWQTFGVCPCYCWRDLTPLESAFCSVSFRWPHDLCVVPRLWGFPFSLAFYFHQELVFVLLFHLLGPLHQDLGLGCWEQKIAFWKRHLAFQLLFFFCLCFSNMWMVLLLANLLLESESLSP